MPNTIRIKAFGMVAEKIGTESLIMENPGSTQNLRLQLFERFPDLKPVKFSLALNKKVIQGDSEIEAGMEIALLPPFSGG